MLRLRATIAVCEVAPPRSVTKPANWCCLNRIMSAGERSCATRMMSSSCAGAAGACPVPSSAFSTRSTTCSTSALRSRRYGVLDLLELVRPGSPSGAPAPTRRCSAACGSARAAPATASSRRGSSGAGRGTRPSRRARRRGRSRAGRSARRAPAATASSKRAISASISLGARSRSARPRAARCVIRCAWPMAMPPETPAPCSVKLAPAGATSAGSTVASLGLAHRPPPSLAFAELVARSASPAPRAPRPRPRRRSRSPIAAALACGEHHHAHDALRVHAAAVARQPDVGARTCSPPA